MSRQTNLALVMAPNDNDAITLGKKQHLGTAKNISEMKRNFKGYCQEKGIDPCPDELESFEAAARDMLANRFSILIGKLRKDTPKEELEKMLLEILK